MRDLVIVPTFSRPEMLWCCLEHISRCDADIDIRVCVDDHRDSHPPLTEIEDVLERFPGVSLTLRGAHDYPGNSYNVLTAYAEAQERRFVFLIEDDVLVEPDFFRWHYRQHELRPLFCSVGVENSRSGQTISAGDYASLGVCFPQGSVREIARHAVTDYFRDMRGYCARKFGSLFSSEDVEQDGLILRIMGSVGGLSAWPTQPVARHIGWYGYHRPLNRPAGSLQQRYQAVQRNMRTVR